MLLAESTRLLSFWKVMLALYVEMRLKTNCARMWCDIRSEAAIGIVFECRSMRSKLSRRKGFLCQVRPRFPIILNAWLVQMHFSMSKLNLIVSDESHQKCKQVASFEWKHSFSRWVCTGKENYCDQQFQSIIFFVEDNWMDLHWSSFSECMIVPNEQVLSKQSFAIDHKFF